MTPFFTTKPAGEGVGLGLAICQGIMDQHGGKLFFTSHPAEGTEFVLEFPVASTLSHYQPSSPLNILVVDDEPFIAELLRERFQLLGHQVQAFTHPKEGLEAAAKGSFDVAFVDLRMPDLDGWKVLKELSALKDLSLYAMSGFEIHQSPQDIPLQGILKKPFDIMEIHSLLMKEMGGRQAA